MQDPNLFVRVSLRSGHFTVPAATAARCGWHVLHDADATDNTGRPLPPTLRADTGAATPPETEPEADEAEGDNTEEQA